MYQTITYVKEGRSVFITLNRPQRLNALSSQMMRELKQAWEQFNADEDAWVAVVTAAGRAFCVGADVSELSEGTMVMARTAREDVAEIGELKWGPHRNRVMKPVVVAVNGICCGGGLDFVTEGDVVIASEDAEFFDPHVSVGLVSNHEMVQMGRRIPLGLALRMAVMGRADRMTARRAYEIGLISEICPRDQLLSRARAIAEAILEQAPLAVRGTKQCIIDGLNLPLDQAVAHGEYIRREVVDSEDAQEGTRSFVEKRAPQWKGR